MDTDDLRSAVAFPKLVVSSMTWKYRSKAFPLTLDVGDSVFAVACAAGSAQVPVAVCETLIAATKLQTPKRAARLRECIFAK